MDSRYIDPELLFQRLIVASNAIDDRKASFRFGSLWRHTHGESTTESRSGESCLDPSATRHYRTNWRDSTYVRRWVIAPSYNMAAWVPNMKRYAPSTVTICHETLGAPSPSSMVIAFHPPSTQHINGAQAAKSESRSPSQEM